MPRSVEQVESEGRVANALRAIGAPLAAVVPRGDGTFAGVLRVRGVDLPAIAYAELGGVEVADPSRAQAASLAVALRKLHGAEIAPAASALPIVEPLRDIEHRLTLASRWLTLSQTRELTSLIENAERRVRRSVLPVCVCHGDVRYANVRFEGDRATLFDLEATGLGPPQYDLACLWRRRIIETGLDQTPPEDWLWLRRAYEAQGAPLFEDESLLRALACLRAFWTMTLPLEPGATWGEDERSSADYWQAHMDQLRWFGRS